MNNRKSILCLFLLFLLSLGSLSVNAQTVSKVFKEQTLKTVLKEIESQTGLSIIYQKNEINENKKVNATFENTPVVEALSSILDKSLEVNLKNKMIVISLKKLMPGDDKTKVTSINGKILDENGEPVIGASVAIQGTTLGSITNIDGEYTLANVPENAEVTISFIGYQTLTFKANDRALQNVTLKEDSEMLDEVVVVGYGVQRKRDVTTSISSMKASELAVPVSSVDQALVGKMTGVQVSQPNGIPGGGLSIKVRGSGSITAGTEPLYVVDGFPMSGEAGNGTGQNVSPLSSINMNDIESIEVLKDASASIYGIGAANGVVLITTKKGKEGKVKVTYDGNISLVKNYPYLDMLDAPSYMKYVNAFGREQYMHDHNMGAYGSAAYDNGFPDVFSDSNIASAKTTNWRDLVLKDGSISRHNITVQGGTKTLNYYLSGNYIQQIGSVSNSEMERFTLRSNVSAQLTSFLKLTTAFNINRNIYQNGTVGGASNSRGEQASGALAAAMSYLPNMPVRDENGNYTLFKVIPNPVAMEDIQNESKNNGYNVNFTVDINIIKNMLAAKFLFGYNNENSERNVYIPSDIYFDQMYKSRGAVNRNERYNTTIEGTISFNKAFGENFRMDAVVGMGRYLNKYTGMAVSYTDNNDILANDNIGAAAGTFTPTSYHREDEKRSQFARASFDLFDRYVIAGTLRRDGTDKFFKGKKYCWFPSVSVAWKIFNEEFMKRVEWVNLLKLRASYGVTGNDNLGSSLHGSYDAFGTHVMFNENSVKYIPYYLKSQDYPDVTWEKTVMKNIGLDFSLLNDRVNGSFDYFWNDITDMLGYANSNGLSMFGSYPINGAHIRRYGWDATLNTVNVTTKDFKWTSVLTLSHTNAIWKERMPNHTYNEYQIRKDEPVNARYYYRTNGLVNLDKSNMPSYQPEAYQKPGCPIIVDLNGDGLITVEDVDMKNVIPSLYWGFGNTFTYKNWDLDVFIYSQLGVDKYNDVYSWTSGRGLGNQTNNMSVYIKDVWHSELNPNGTIPGIAYEMASVSLPGGAGTDIGYENSSFVRVRNITLGYNFKPNQLGALSKLLSGIRVYVDVQNPFTFTGYTGLDPEVNTGGNYKGGKAEYPQTRTFSLGAKLSF